MRRHFAARVLIGTALCVSVSGPEARAQSDQATLEFDVVSVRPNVSGNRGDTVRWFPGGRFTATNVTVRSLLLLAYRLYVFQLDELPSWATTSRFDIQAVANTDVPADKRSELLRGLLEQRFGARLRQMEVQRQGYVLTKARSDGRLGEFLKPTSVDCKQQDPPLTTVCGAQGNLSAFKATGVRFSVFVGMLTQGLGVMVDDRTELSGLYDILFYSDGNPSPTAKPNPKLPSVRTAVQEQLGLRLSATRVTVPIYVVDSLRQPEPD